MLGRPHSPGIETVNDLDCMVANFWRALQHAPDTVAAAADWPVNEADQHARHRWLSSQADFRERMKCDPYYYDAKIAGWWVWGQCIWIGGGWCGVKLPGRQSRKLPHLGNGGCGINRKLPHLGDGGRGINRKRYLTDAGNGIHRKSIAESGSDLLSSNPLRAYMERLATRLRRVRVCCGDWSRITGESVTVKQGITGVFLDPPYSAEAGRDANLYATESLTVAHEVRSWAVANGENPLLRIALCGYEGEHNMPQNWQCVDWKTQGGYGSVGRADSAGQTNSGRERIWFSPHCLGASQAELF